MLTTGSGPSQGQIDPFRALARIEARRRRTDDDCAADLLYWLQNHTQTEDEHWLKKGTPPTAPFPKKKYFRILLPYLQNEETLFLPKSREMMISWFVCGYITHLCQWLPHIFYIIQTKKEETAASLLEYCNVLYRNQAQWLKDKHPLAGGNMTEMHWGNGSHILAVPKGADQVRKHHPYGYFQDESAFLPEAEASFNAVKPVAKQIICVSSAAPGWFGNMSDKNLAVVE
jgi:hypothetical protein